MDDGFEGAFFAVCDKPRSWFRLGGAGSASTEAVDECMNGYVSALEQETAFSPDGPLAQLARTPESALTSPRHAAQSKVQKYLAGVNDQCALTVLPAASSIGAHLVRVLPYVSSSPEFLLCFCGYLSNASELAEQLGAHNTPGDRGMATTQLVLRAYQRMREGDKDERLFISELQGHFAFYLYDAARKCAFAARDPSGQQELFYTVDADSCSLYVTNCMERLPAAQTRVKWREVPPGHFISGPKPALHQFALTPRELEGRTRLESLDLGSLGCTESGWDDGDEPSPHGHERYDGADGSGNDRVAGGSARLTGPKQLIAAALSLSRRTSLAE
ncbi:hypothetical protein FOA52_000082 [Chlamydomonas sp. UWO 241]|nr:hypothetical protein FOA52_000082 [Chlamydomonas sp. UWO 241]